MADIDAVLDPTPLGGEDINSATDTKTIIQRSWRSTFPNASHVATPYYGTGIANWRYRIADANVLTPREGTHSFMTRLRLSDADFVSGGKTWNRNTFQTGQDYTTVQGDEKWFGWSHYIRGRANEPNANGSPPSGISFHVVGDEHTSTAPGAGTMWWIQNNPGGKTKLGIHRESSGGTSVTLFDGQWWEQNTWIDWVVHVVFQPITGGRLEIWSRKWPSQGAYTKLVDYSGGIGFVDDFARWQIDSYIHTDAPKWGRENFYSTVRIAGSNGSFAAVEPGQSSQGPTQVLAPVFSPNGGTFVGSTNVTITSGTIGSTIAYTTDGSTPSQTNGTQIASGGTAAITASGQLRAIAFRSGDLPSGVTSANFVINSPVITTPFRINCGGAQHTGSGSIVWLADQYFNGGSVSAVSTNPVSNADPEDAVLYQIARFWANGADGSYPFPIANGQYQVNLHHNEFYAPMMIPGGRVFDVSINGTLVSNDLDVWSQVGGNAALVTSYSVDVTAGELSIEFSPSANNATIKAIEILDITTSGGTGDVVVEPAQAACPTSNGTFNITTTNLGGKTPVGVILTITKATANGTAVADAVYGVGLADGSNQYAMGATADDNIGGGTTSRKRAMTDKCLFAVNPGGGILLEAAFSAWIADGVTLNLTTAPPAGYLINAEFYAGDDTEFYVATVNASASGIDITGAGFEPTDVVAFGSGASAIDTQSGTPHISLGRATNRDATITQYAYGVKWQSGTPSIVAAGIATDRIGGKIEHSSGSAADWDYKMTVGDFDADGCTVTATADAGAIATGNDYGIALIRLPNVASKIIEITSPGAPDATNAVTGVGFEPSSVCQIMTTLTAVDVVASDDEASGFCIGSFSASDEYVAGWSADDGAATTDTSSVANQKAVHLLGSDGAADLVANVVSLDAGGFTLNYTTATAALKGFAWLTQSSTAQQVPDPSINPDGGVFPTGTTVPVTLTAGLSGVSLYYTTDGSTPDATDTLYSGSFDVTSTTTLKVIGIKSGLTNSNVITAVFTLQATVEAPVITPGAGTYGGPREIMMESGTSGATIYYTTDGSTPDATDTEYTGPFTLAAIAATTIKAIGIKSGLTDSAITTEVITISSTLDAPDISPLGGTHRPPLPIEMSTDVAGATLWYTTDGTTPSEGGGTSIQYTSDPIIVDDQTIKVIAVLDGFTDSAVETAIFEMMLHRVHAKRLRDRGL